MCEAIATSNAISDHYGKTAFFPDVLDTYMKMNLVLDGYGGTSPLSIPILLSTEGINTVFYYADDLTPEKYQYLCGSCDGVILTSWNTENPSDAIHTMYIEIDEAPESSTGYSCLRHNDDTKLHSTPDNDLQALVEGYNPDGAICIIGVMKE